MARIGWRFWLVVIGMLILLVLAYFFGYRYIGFTGGQIVLITAIAGIVELGTTYAIIYVKTGGELAKISEFKKRRNKYWEFKD